MVLFHVPELDQPACAKPEHLPLVDAAYIRPGGAEAAEMRDRLCRHCPAAAQCLDEAMRRGELGVWAGTSPHMRTRHGGAKPQTGRGKAAGR